MQDFIYKEFICTSAELLGVLKQEITGFSSYPTREGEEGNAIANTWEVFDEELEGSYVKQLTLKGTVKIGSLTKDIYVKLTNRFFTDPDKHSSLTIQVLDGYDEVESSFRNNGPPVIYEWADEQYTPTDRDEEKPIYGYINVMNNRVVIVLTADPAVNFSDYYKAFAYFGAIKPFKFNMDDVEGNVLVTAGCKTPEKSMQDLASEGEYYFGEYTSLGNNTFQMLKTKSGILFQRHYPAYITQAPPVNLSFRDSSIGETGIELDPQGFQASRWTGKYHMSPIYVVHPFEGYRGSLEQCVAVLKHNILHLDELIVDVEGKDWDQEVYKFFDTSTDQTFFNYSPNLQMGIAILKEVRYLNA